MSTPPTTARPGNEPPLTTTPALAPGPIAPVASGERIAALDVLRGFAIFGILLVNMELFRAPIYNFFLPPPADESLPDTLARWFIFSFAAAKFYTIFSLLFGIGMSIQLDRVRQRGAAFSGLYVRRLLVLLLIGLVHSVFVWFGDVLVSYALLGFALLLLRGLPRLAMLILALVAYAAPFVLFGLATVAVELLKLTPEGAETINAQMQEAHANYAILHAWSIENYSAGDFWAAYDQRLLDHASGATWTLLSMWPGIIAMFLLGRVVWLRGIFQDPARHRGLLRWLSTWGLAGGVVCGALYGWLVVEHGMAVLSWSMLNSMSLQAVGTPLLSFGYVAVIVRMVQSGRWQRQLSPLAAVGRMALTNYLLQSVVCTLIFNGYGLGWFGRVGPAAGLVLTVAIFAAQIPLSVWWLRHFRFGPLEWLWRTLTYCRWQPMRKATQGATSAAPAVAEGSSVTR